MIEDDRKISLALAIRLKAKGYEVLTAGDALGGVAMALKHEPDLIILDIAMPAGDGFSVADKIQGRANTAGTPIIVITAARRPDWRERAKEFGVAAYFEKPFRASHLIAAVEKALGETADAQPAAGLAPHQPILAGRW